MKAICDTCGARYRIPEEKLEGKILRIRCRKCDNVFTVRDDEAPTLTGVSRPDLHTPQGDWYFAINGESFGPYTEDELQHRFESGRLDRDTHIWRQGMDAWVPVSDYPPFAAAIELAQNALPSMRGTRASAGRAAQADAASDHSGRFTVEVRRPGATIGETLSPGFSASADDVSDDVDNAFDSLIDTIQSSTSTSKMTRAVHDPQETETAPMRPLGGASSPLPGRASTPTRPVTPASPGVRTSAAGASSAPTTRASTSTAAAASKPPTRPTSSLPSRTTPTPAASSGGTPAAKSSARTTAATPIVQRASDATRPASNHAGASTTSTTAHAAAAPADAKARADAKTPAPTRPTSGLPPAGGPTSLSERLRQIRERSAATSAGTTPATEPGTGLPARNAGAAGGLPPRRSTLPPSRASGGLPLSATTPRSDTSTADRATISARTAESIRARDTQETPPAGSPDIDALASSPTEVSRVQMKASGLDQLGGLFDEPLDNEATQIGHKGPPSETQPTAPVPMTVDAAHDAVAPSMGHTTLFDDNDTLFDEAGAEALFARPAVDARPAAETPARQVASLPLPQGPIRQVTQEISLDDLFGDDDFHEDTTPDSISSFAVSTDAATQVKAPASVSGETTAVASPLTAPTPRATATTTASTASPAVRPSTGAHAALQESSIRAAASARTRRAKQLRLLLVAIAGLTFAAMLLLFMMSRRSAAIAAQATIAAQEAAAAQAAREAEARRQADAFIMARNRASSVVALAVTKASRAAHVAGEEHLAAAKAAEAARQANVLARSTRSDDTPADMGFHVNATARPVSTSSRSSSNSGPSASHFSGTLQGGVRTSVGRCAQRARARDGGLNFSRVELSITIRPDGTVERIDAPRGIRDSTFMNCMKTESTRWRFASFSGGSTTITHPFVVQ